MATPPKLQNFRSRRAAEKAIEGLLATHPRVEFTVRFSGSKARTTQKVKPAWFYYVTGISHDTVGGVTFKISWDLCIGGEVRELTRRKVS